MYLAFQKRDNLYCGFFRTLDITGQGQYDWYFVKVKDDFDDGYIKSYIPIEEFKPNYKQSLQVTAMGKIIKTELESKPTSID